MPDDILIKRGGDPAAETPATPAPDQQDDGGRGGATFSANPDLPPGAAPAPLTFGQERRWRSERRQPSGATANAQVALRLEGKLNQGALGRSLSAIVRRHDALRAAIFERDGEPRQSVREAHDVDLPLTPLKQRNRLREGPAADLEMALRLRALVEAQRPFDLATELPLRATLLRISPRDHVLVMTIPRLVADDLSLDLILREIADLYAAFAAGRPSPLAEPAPQLADFAVWQRGASHRAVLDEQRAFWTQRLAGLEPLRLPVDRPRLAHDQRRGGRQPLPLPAPLAADVATLSGQQGVPLVVTLLAAWQALLARYAGDDVAVGSPVSGRSRPGTDQLVGQLANTIVLRTDLAGDPSFRDLLGRVRAVVAEAECHQDLPFEQVLASLATDPDTRLAPPANVGFALRSSPLAPPRMGALTVTRLELEPAPPPFDLSLEMAEENGELRAWLEYDIARFDAGTVERLGGQWRTLLGAAVADPDRPLSTLPLLSPAERHQVLVEWNATDTSQPESAVIQHLFEAQVEASPDALAVIDDQESLTYDELNRRANRLAHHLRAIGVGPDVRVGLSIERSAALIVGMLGILKAGAAYLPLDPSYPRDRLAAMIEDANASVIVARNQLPHDLLAPGVTIVDLDTDAALLGSRPERNPTSATDPEHLAYVIYTSGSTGTPKGVAVPHRAVVRLVVNTDYVQIQHDDVIAQASNAAFDAITWEVWGSLLHGAKVVVIPRDVVLAPRELAASLDRHRVSVIFLTTALFHQAARETPTAFAGVRQLMVGGEAMDPRAAATVLVQGAPGRLVHIYGPTETTTFAACYPVERVAEGASSVPIGRPIANTSIYILDDAGQPVPVGVPGELYIGGLGVARGYLNRPALTSERFVPDPFADRPGARLYRTGDRVRYLADGNVEFLGRVDNQVKIRGFRVEPGEIEGVLSRHPGVAETVVVARADVPGTKRLVGYVVLAADPWPTASDLREFLKTKLPDYMLPSAIIPMDSLPLTPNGKVDRAALPAPDGAGWAAADGYAAPRTATEAALAAGWADLLGLDRVSVDDDFFDLGGHSLLVAQATSMIRDSFGVDLPPRVIFEAPTVAELATKVEAAQRTDRAAAPQPTAAAATLVPLQAGGAKRPVFLVPGGEGRAGKLIKYAQLARKIGPDQPFYGFLEEGIEVDADGDPHAWVEATATAHLYEIRARQPEGPYTVAGACVGGVLAYEIARQLLAAGQRVDLLVLLDTLRPDRGLGRAAEHVQQRLRERTEKRARQRFAKDPTAQPGAEPDSPTPPNLLDRAREELPTVANDEQIPALDIDDLDITPRGLNLYGYKPRPYTGRVLLFMNEEWHREGANRGWEELVHGDLETAIIPGAHNTYLFDHLDLVADRFRAALAASES